MKQELMAKAEAAIEAMLAKAPEANKTTMWDIDRLVIKVGREIQVGIVES